MLHYCNNLVKNSLKGDGTKGLSQQGESKSLAKRIGFEFGKNIVLWWRGVKNNPKSKKVFWMQAQDEEEFWKQQASNIASSKQ